MTTVIVLSRYSQGRMSMLKKTLYATLVATALGASTMVVDAPYAAAATISCSGKQNNPHRSSHVPGTVNAQAVVKCTGPVTSLSGNVTLVRDDGATARSGVIVRNNTKSWRGNAALKCDGKTHSYTATVVMTWTGPPSWKPQTLRKQDSATATVKC